MKKKRVIPVILLRNGQIVQSKLFKEYKNLGNPFKAVERFSNWDADELIYLEISRDQVFERSDLNSLEYKTSSPLQEIERIRKFRQQNSNQLMFVKVPWAKRNSGKATGASIKTLESVFRDLLILVRKH